LPCTNGSKHEQTLVVMTRDQDFTRYCSYMYTHHVRCANYIYTLVANLLILYTSRKIMKVGRQ